jgi:hypothetical protein
MLGLGLYYEVYASIPHVLTGGQIKTQPYSKVSRILFVQKESFATWAVFSDREELSTLLRPLAASTALMEWLGSLSENVKHLKSLLE